MRWRTPKRCCSSTTTSPRRANSTDSWMSAWVPVTTLPPPSARAASTRGALAGVGPPGEQQRLDPERAEEALQAAGVLLGEQLGGRHEGGLMPALHREQHGEDGDDRLPRPDIPLKHAVHAAVRGHVRVDLSQHPGLGVGQAKPQRLVQGADEPVGAAKPECR